MPDGSGYHCWLIQQCGWPLTCMKHGEKTSHQDDSQYRKPRIGAHSLDKPAVAPRVLVAAIVFFVFLTAATIVRADLPVWSTAAEQAAYSTQVDELPQQMPCITVAPQCEPYILQGDPNQPVVIDNSLNVPPLQPAP